VNLNLSKLAVAVMMALTISSAIIPSPSFATGFPVVDIASIAQAVAEYSTQLEQYSEQMQQTVLGEGQLSELIATYEQAMISYDHMLVQMSGLPRMIDARDYGAIANKFASVIDSYPGNVTDFSSSNWVAKGRALSSLNTRIDSVNDLEAAIRALPLDSRSSANTTTRSNQAFAREQLAVGQSMFVDNMSDQLQTQVVRYGDVAQQRAALGPEDHLKTLQVMAQQNELIIEGVQQTNAINTAQMQYSNQLPTHFFALQDQARMSTFAEAKAKLDAMTVVNESNLIDY
jgi:phage-related protein